MQEGEPLRFDGTGEQALFDGFAQEQVAVSGTPVDYWCINVPDSVKDPLYGEAKIRRFAGPFKVMGSFTAPSVNPSPEEFGLTGKWDAAIWIARKSFEDAGAPIPNEGDVLRTWNLPYYIATSTMEPEPVPSAGYFFNVVQLGPDGYVGDSPIFVGYKFTLTRRAEFTPERRIERP